MAGRGDTLATQDEDSVQAVVETCEDPFPEAWEQIPPKSRRQPD
jgi:hypothetical protein